MQFKDLEFGPREGLGGIQAVCIFPNGYGASVIQGFGSYGNERGLYELAVVNVVEGGWALCYSSPLTDDVFGNLTEDDVSHYLAEIEALSEYVA